MKPALKRIAIACGGTGGHLFPGLAVGDALVARGCEVTLLVSSREVDQTAVKSAYGMEVESLPVVGLSRNRSEEHTSELQSRTNLVCRLLLEKKKNKTNKQTHTQTHMS